MKDKIALIIIFMLLTVSAVFCLDVDADEPDTEIHASVSCAVGTYDGDVTVEIVNNKTVRVLFDPALPDEDCCNITLSGCVDASFKVRTLVGDVDFDGQVITVDASKIVSRLEDPVTQDNFWYDVDTDGQISISDKAEVEARYQNTAPEGSYQSTTIISAWSCMEHNGTKFCLNLTENNIEPRVSGVTEIEFNLKETLSLQLLVDSPLSVIENGIFEIIVTADDNPIGDVEVTFDDCTSYTDVEGKVSFTAPFVDESTSYFIEASKECYNSATKMITVFDRQLTIIVIASIIENETFKVTVKEEHSEEVVADVDVTFNEVTNQTDANGQVIFKAPEVNQAISYIITATMDGFQPDTASIKVLNIDVDELKGFVYGVVFDTSTSSPIENVKIEASGEQKRWIIYTDAEGKYVLSVPAATYNLVASKEGYKQSTRNNVNVNDKSAIEVNFMLEKSTEDGGESTGMAGFIIRSQIREGRISAEIEESYVTLYSENVDVEIINNEPLAKGGISLIIKGEGSDTIIAIYLPEVTENEKLVVTYDEEEIEETQNLESFFSNDNTNAEYILLQSSDLEYVLCLRIPEFSEHTITITSLIETIGGITALIFYILIVVVALVVFIVPTLTNFIRFRRTFQNKGYKR